MEFDIYHDAWLTQTQIGEGLDGILQVTQAMWGSQTLSNLGLCRKPGWETTSGMLVEGLSVDWALSTAWNSSRTQANAAVLLANASQLTEKKFVLFTAYDLYVEGTNFCLGLCVPELGAVVSVNRLKGNLEVFKSVCMHEFGHLVGLVPEYRRGRNTRDFLGLHCTNRGCIMRQGENLATWEGFTRERLRGGKVFCNECQQDLIAASYFSR